jgi:hypothetical protein
VDYITFSRLLGFDHHDREAPALSDIFYNGINNDDLRVAQMYKSEHLADGKTTFLKPTFFVLNNLLRTSIDPKIGDQDNLQADAPKILCRFGASGGCFSVTDFMWSKIADVAVDSHKSLPYAPYLMYIVEQVVGYEFSHDTKHASYTPKLLAPCTPKDAPASTSAPAPAAADDPQHGGTDDAPLGGAPIAPPPRGERWESSTKFAFKKFLAYFCYTTKRTDERLRRLEEQANLAPVSPLCEFPDPYAQYHEMYGSSSGGAAAGVRGRTLVLWRTLWLVVRHLWTLSLSHAWPPLLPTMTSLPLRMR